MTVAVGLVGGPGKTTVTVWMPVEAFAGMVMELVTCVWETWTLPVPVMVPTVTLLIGAFCGGGLTEGSRLIVKVMVVPRVADPGEMLRMPTPVPELGLLCPS